MYFTVIVLVVLFAFYYILLKNLRKSSALRMMGTLVFFQSVIIVFRRPLVKAEINQVTYKIIGFEVIIFLIQIMILSLAIYIILKNKEK